MKTNIVDIKVLKNIIKTKSNQNSRIKCWVCGKEYWEDLFDVATSEDVYIDYWGVRRLLGIQVAIVEGHPKLKDNEIVLFTEMEFKYALKLQENGYQEI